MVWERELRVLEEAIRRVNVEYDAFLYGTAPRPPFESRKHVEQMIRKLYSSSIDVAAERYRFATLQERYSALCERWERLQQEKEAGRRPGLYGHFSAGGAGPARGGGTAGQPPPNAAGLPSVESSREESADRRLFEEYVAAKKARGENVDAYVYERFAENLEKERARLLERSGGAGVVFEVAERDGKVKLVARRAEGGTPAPERKR